jgi:hypothetical protein
VSGYWLTPRNCGGEGCSLPLLRSPVAPSVGGVCVCVCAHVCSDSHERLERV